jgi:uncharacterized membrane protein YgcG
MRAVLVLSLACSLAWSPMVQALEVPAFEPGQRVYVVPESFQFPTKLTRAAVGETHQPIYVVVYEKVIDGNLGQGFESETEEAIEAVWSAWRTAEGLAEAPVEGGVDTREGSLVLLAMDDREVRIMAGSRWDAELGLHNEALLPVIDQHFMPLAQAQDFDGGLAALVGGLDGTITGALAKREAAVQAELERQAREAREAEEAAARSQAREDAIAYWLPWVGAGTGAGVVLLLLAFFRLVAMGLRDRYREAAARLEAQLEAADASFADFRIDVELRDRIVDLRLKGPVTTALYEEVSRGLDEIQAGLAGLRRHLRDCEPQGVGLFARAPWTQALERLEGRFEIRTEQTQDRLFPAPAQVLEVEPAVFMEGLEERFGVAKQGWKRLLDAVEVSLHKAEQDLARDDLEAALAKLDEAGLPQTWVEEHPLFEDPRAVWDELDELRREDPVAYLDELEALVALDDELEALVDDVIEGLRRGAELRREAEEPSVAELATIIADPERDPAALRAQADELLRRLQDIGHGRIEPSADDFDACLDALEACCEDWVARKRALIATVERAPSAVAEAEERLKRLEVEYAQARERAKAASREQLAEAMGPAWNEVAEARDDLEQLREAALQAGSQLREHRHVQAERSAERALREHGEAVRNLAELAAILDRLEQARDEAETLRASLSARRAALLDKLAGYGSFGGAQHLHEGDRLRDAVEASWGAGLRQDWEGQAARLREVLGAWNAGVQRAAAAWRAEQARLEAIRLAEERRRHEEERRRREEERRRRRERERQRRRSSSSFGSSSRSSFSSLGGSSGSQSSSRRKSSGSSFGSRRRSSGRKVASRRRSGGRKF